MNILLTPQVNISDKATYEYGGETITATVNGETETFDLSNIPEGMQRDPIPTTLPINPFTEVRRANGVLYVKLINFVLPNATKEENYPEWIEV